MRNASVAFRSIRNNQHSNDSSYFPPLLPTTTTTSLQQGCLHSQLFNRVLLLGLFPFCWSRNPLVLANHCGCCCFVARDETTTTSRPCKKTKGLLNTGLFWWSDTALLFFSSLLFCWELSATFNLSFSHAPSQQQSQYWRRFSQKRDFLGCCVCKTVSIVGTDISEGSQFEFVT